MSRTLHIAVDMDGVVLDFVGGLVKAVNTEHDAGLTRMDVTEWHLDNLLNPIIGRNWWDWMRERKWLWSEVFDAVPGAIGALDQLRRDGHYLEILTSKPRWAEEVVWRWLGKWRLPIHKATIVPLDRTEGSHKKSQWSNAEVLIDDRDSNIKEWVSAPGAYHERKGILFDAPYNQDFLPVPPRQVRALDWKHVLEHIEEWSA